MKKTVFLLMSILVLVSCTKDFITKNPLGVGSDVTWFDTEEQCRWAVNAIYDPLGWQATYSRTAEAFDMMSDEAEKGGNPASADAYKSDQSGMYAMMLGNASSLTGEIGRLWESYYVMIARANLMLEKTKDKDDIDAYKEMRAEARFLRAFAYMDLVKMFGPVPLVKEPILPKDAASKGNREYGDADAQVKAIYDYIIDELIAIKGILPLRQPDTYFGRATDAAVQAYLAKAYLYARDFPNAYATAEKLINSEAKGLYGLEAKYHHVFHFDKIYDESSIKEIIFSIQHIPGEGGNASDRNGNNEGTIRVIDQGPRVFVGATGPGYGLVIPSKTLVDAFEVGDPRLDMIGKAAYTDNKGNAQPADSIFWKGSANAKGVWRKFGKNSYTTGNNTLKMFLNADVYYAAPKDQAQGKDLILMRWAEVLLIGAEAAARTNKDADAKKWVNEVRQRARDSKCIQKDSTMALYKFADPGTWKIPADLSTVTLADVKKERQLELFCENGTRYFDLVRWNADGDAISADAIMSKITTDLVGETRTWIKGKHGVFPIPANQIMLQKGSLVQNNGY